MTESNFTMRVIDLKQYVYCPRILYYHTILPAVRPVTYKMEAGITAHHQEERREKRRSLKSYGLNEGKCTFNVSLFSAELGLSGELDMLIETDTEYIPVDYKHSKKAGKHFKLQLMAYGRLLETLFSSEKTVKRGFLYFIPTRQAVSVTFTKSLRRQLKQTLPIMQQIAWEQLMPAPTTYPARCVDCEFKRFCNDVI